jgi:hypothetical protein
MACYKWANLRHLLVRDTFPPSFALGYSQEELANRCYNSKISDGSSLSKK